MALALAAPALAEPTPPGSQAGAARATSPPTGAPRADTAESGYAPARDLSKYKEEPVPGGTLLVVAYAVMWLLVGAFLARLLLRQGQLERDLHALQERLDAPGALGQRSDRP